MSPIVNISVEQKQKEVQQWSNVDFLKYFSERLKPFNEQKGLTIPPKAWGAFVGRIKGFRAALKVSPQMYKRFIDIVFDDFFVQDGYIPTFGTIVSEKVYNILMTSSTHGMVYDNTYYLQLKQKLKINNNLYQKLF